MKIAVIIIHYGRPETTEECLKLLKSKIGNNRLILINNTSSKIDKLSRIISGTSLIDNRTNLGFARAVNQGIVAARKEADVDAYLLMNNDLIFSFGSLDRLAKTFLDKRGAGIVSPVLHHGGLYDWGGKFNRLTGMVRHRNFAQKPKTVLTVDHVAGAAMLIRKEVVEKIGLLDERFFLYYEDLDYCLRAQAAGFSVHINPEVVAIHAVSAGSRPLKRTLYQWHSHLQFVLKYLPLRVFPTALIYDFIFYPLVLMKIILFRR